jgi:hypothetical protein
MTFSWGWYRRSTWQPLQPEARDEAAAWICPGTSQVIPAIDALAGVVRGPRHVRSNGSA